MRFLYCAPRYHTNQAPIMKGLVEHGHAVLFLSQYAGEIEDYSYVKPVVIGYSKIFTFFDSIYMKWKNGRNPGAANKKIKAGFPPVLPLFRQIKRFRPDVAILRERSVYTIFTCQICRLLGIPAVLYNQSPLWEDRIKNDIPHKLVRRLTPGWRITPVLGIREEGMVKEPGAYFVPFVMEPVLSPEKKVYGRDGLIHIFCIGKYENRKNHLMMIEVIERLARDYPLQLTIAGECSTAVHQEYYRRLEDYIQSRNMEKIVTLYCNLNRERMQEEYGKADLFVIPSTLEPASISQLEAMAFSLPVICSDTNGTACYVEQGVNGYWFRDNQRDALQEAVEKLVKNPERMRKMGEEGYRIIEKKCGFLTYFQGIEAMLNQRERENGIS